MHKKFHYLDLFYFKYPFLLSSRWSKINILMADKLDLRTEIVFSVPEYLNGTDHGEIFHFASSHLGPILVYSFNPFKPNELSYLYR